MRTLRIEMHRGGGWRLQEYAIQYPHRALVDGVARAGEVKQRPDALEDQLASN
jgi:hypothetical protein